MKTQQQYIQYLSECINLLKETPFSTEKLKSIRSALESTTCFVPIMGAFSSGKSSLINQLLGESVLAVGITPETELATALRYSDTPHIIATCHDKTTQHFAIDQLSLVQQQAAQWAYISLYLDHPLLQSLSPLVLVDMPGFATYEGRYQVADTPFIQHAIRAFVLISAEQGTLSKVVVEELEQLKSMQIDCAVILSKSNLKATSDIEVIAQHLSSELADIDCSLVACVGVDDVSRQLLPLLQQLNPDQFIHQLFLPKIQHAADDIFSLIGFQKSGLHKDQKDVEVDMQSIQKDISALKFSQSQLKTDMEYLASESFINYQISQVSHELKKNQQMLVADFVSRGCQHIYLIDQMIDLIKSILTQKIEEQIQLFSNKILEIYSSQIANIDLSFLQQRINTDQKKTQQGILLALYQCFDRIIRSLQKILPASISNLVNDYQEQQINIKLEQDIFPAIRTILQQHLGQALIQKLHAIDQQISADILQQLEQKQVLLEQLQKTQSQAKVDAQQQKDQLRDLEVAFYNLSETVLY